MDTDTKCYGISKGKLGLVTGGTTYGQVFRQYGIREEHFAQLLWCYLLRLTGKRAYSYKQNEYSKQSKPLIHGCKNTVICGMAGGRLSSGQVITVL